MTLYPIAGCICFSRAHGTYTKIDRPYPGIQNNSQQIKIVEIQIVSSDINKINIEIKKSEKIPEKIYKHLNNNIYLKQCMFQR